MNIYSIYFFDKRNSEIDLNFIFKYKFYKIKRLLKRRDIKKNIKYLIK